jgi:hypothetical protein
MIFFLGWDYLSSLTGDNCGASLVQKNYIGFLGVLRILPQIFFT